jgi:hypothetical protein
VNPRFGIRRSVSLGCPARFLFGELKRTDLQQRVPWKQAVVVWRGRSRLAYYGPFAAQRQRVSDRRTPTAKSDLLEGALAKRSVNTASHIAA